MMDKIAQHPVESQNFRAVLLPFPPAELCAFVLSGSMDAPVVDQLQERASAVLAGRRWDYLVDLEAVTYVSSTGLGFLMHLLKHKKDFVYLSNPGPAVLKPLNLFDIKHLFRYYQTLDDLERSSGLPAELIASIRDQKQQLKRSAPPKKSLETLGDYLDNEQELHEIQQMMSSLPRPGDRNEITLPAEERYAIVLGRFLEGALELASQRGGPPVEKATAELVAKELMANAVEHGYGRQPGGLVEIRYSLGDMALEIEFGDHGRGFSPSTPTEGVLPSAGLEMMRRIFDKLEIGPGDLGRPKGLVLGPGTTVRLSLRLGPVSGGHGESHGAKS